MDPIGFTQPHPAQFRRLGHVFYNAGLRMQKALADCVLAGDRPDQILILEHNPVFTLGKSADATDIHVSHEFLAGVGIQVAPTDRGGKVTYHGPGQIVLYPICNLREGRKDVGRLVRGLEEAMIRTARDFGVQAIRIQGAPGIWVETPRGLEKLGAIGMHLSRWISTHGLAFNVAPDMGHYRYITPCGFTDRGVCSLATLLGAEAPNWETAADHLQGHLQELLALVPVETPAPQRSISALVWRKSAQGPEVLMMHRQPWDGGWWSSVTGSVEPGESLEDAARREVLEETGLDGTLQSLELTHCFWVDPSLLGLPSDELRFNQESCFHLEVEPTSEVHLDLREHSEYQWLPIPQAEALTPWEGSKAALKRLAVQVRTHSKSIDE